jgi:outer membrane protein assembly factor BamD
MNLRPTLLRLSIALFALCGAAALSRAEIVWTPETGWRIEGGVLTLLTPEDTRRAIDLMNRAREAQERGNFRSALANYRRVTKRFARSDFAPEAFYQIGLLHMERREYARAFDAFDEILQRYPNYGRFNELIARQYEIGTMLADGKRQRLFGFIPWFANRDRGITQLERVVQNAPFAEQSPGALLRVAEGHRRAQRSSEEIDALDRFINIYNLDRRAPDAYLDLAIAHKRLSAGPRYDQGATRQALSYFQDFSILYPTHPRVAEAEAGVETTRNMLAESRLEMGDWYLRHRANPTAALVFYNEVITIAPDSPLADRARAAIERANALAEFQAANPPSKRWDWIAWLWR